MSTRGATDQRERGGAKPAALAERKTKAQEQREKRAAKQAEMLRFAARAERQAEHQVQAFARLSAARQRNPNAFRAVGRPRLTVAGQRTLRAEAERRDAKSLSTMDRERALVVDPKTGRIIVDRTGTSDAVYLRFNPTAQYPGKRGEQSEMEGRIYIHNHPLATQTDDPANWTVRGTFSELDYYGRPGIARSHTHSAAVIYGNQAVIMTPRKDGTWPTYGREVKPALDRHWAAIDRAAVAQARRRGTPAAARRSLVNLTNAELLHLAWRRAARDLGITYQRVPVSALAQ